MGREFLKINQTCFGLSKKCENRSKSAHFLIFLAFFGTFFDFLGCF